MKMKNVFKIENLLCSIIDVASCFPVVFCLFATRESSDSKVHGYGLTKE